VKKVKGHGFVTEYAQPTSALTTTDPALTTLTRSYPYVTRLYTSIEPSQIDLDPGFVAASGLPNVSAFHEIPNPASSQPLSCPPSGAVIVGGLVGSLVVVAGGVILFVVLRRRRNARAG
jgi:hypothetical protein